MKTFIQEDLGTWVFTLIAGVAIVMGLGYLGDNNERMTDRAAKYCDDATVVVDGISYVESGTNC